MIYIRSTAFLIIYFLLNTLLFIGGLPLFLLGNKAVAAGCRVWSNAVILNAKYIAGINYEVVGKIPTAPCIIASKHQSAWETAAFAAILKNPAFILKKELLFIPLFGLYLLGLQHIYINRSKGASSLKKMLAQARHRLSEGRQIIIFPEGTRTKPNATPNYKSGVAMLYAGLNAPVVPVQLNSGEFWGKNAFLKKSGKITVRFLEEMPPHLPKQEFMQELQRRIEGV